jgi:hypothetical protein
MLARGTITTWKELEDKFLEKFFTHTHTHQTLSYIIKLISYFVKKNMIV